nr:adult-specific rigid cuticular protein 15.7-like isoform X1 [Dermacentor andersoni]
MAKMVILLGLVVAAVTLVHAQQDQSGAYQFKYDIKDPEGGSHFHEESSDAGGARRGSYGMTNREGQYVKVEYTADENGYKPVIDSNVPGVSRQG